MTQQLAHDAFELALSTPSGDRTIGATFTIPGHSSACAIGLDATTDIAASLSATKHDCTDSQGAYSFTAATFNRAGVQMNGHLAYTTNSPACQASIDAMFNKQ
jgi:hypothetical protein